MSHASVSFLALHKVLLLLNEWHYNYPRSNEAPALYIIAYIIIISQITDRMACSRNLIRKFIYDFHIMMMFHNPHLIGFVSNMQWQRDVICGSLPFELFLISLTVGGPVYMVQSHVFVPLSVQAEELSCSSASVWNPFLVCERLSWFRDIIPQSIQAGVWLWRFQISFSSDWLIHV